jgi:TolA-binding protein
LGKAYYNDGRFAEAAAAFSSFVKEYPDSTLVPEAYLNLGWAYERQALFDEARKTWRMVEDKFPNSPAAPAAWAASAQKDEAEDPRRGAESWSALADKYPNSSLAPGSLFRAGLLYIDTIRPATAAECFVRLRQMFPDAKDYPESFYWEGVAREALGDTAKALAAYEAFLVGTNPETAPGGAQQYGEAVMGKARCLNRQDDPTKAISFLRTRIETGGIPPDVLAAVQSFLGNLLLERGRFEEAMPVLQAVVDRSRGDLLEADAQLRIAKCLEGLGRLTEASSAYLKTAYLYPKATGVAAEAEYRAAGIFEKQRQYREALRHYQRAAAGETTEEIKKQAAERAKWLASHIDALEIELETE